MAMELWKAGPESLSLYASWRMAGSPRNCFDDILGHKAGLARADEAGRKAFQERAAEAEGAGPPKRSERQSGKRNENGTGAARERDGNAMGTGSGRGGNGGGNEAGAVPEGDGGRPAPGVPGADRSLGDRAAVPCRPVTSLERGPTAYTSRVRLIAPAEPRVVLAARPWLARTSGPTKPVGIRSRAVRVRRDPNSGPWRSGSAFRRGFDRGFDRGGEAPGGTQTRPRHSSRSVMASWVPGLPRASL